jgi:hypothetical protein
MDTLHKGDNDDDDDNNNNNNVTNNTSTLHCNHRVDITFYKGKYPAQSNVIQFSTIQFMIINVPSQQPDGQL